MGKEFHYVLLLVLIALLVWRKMDGSKLLQHDLDLYEARTVALLWATKNPNLVIET